MSAQPCLYLFLSAHSGLHPQAACTPAQAAEFQKRLLTNETRFILAVVSGDLVVSNRRRADITADLEAGGYDRMPPNKKVPCLPKTFHAVAVLFERHSRSAALSQHKAIAAIAVSRQRCIAADFACCCSAQRPRPGSRAARALIQKAERNLGCCQSSNLVDTKVECNGA